MHCTPLFTVENVRLVNILATGGDQSDIARNTPFMSTRVITGKLHGRRHHRTKIDTRAMLEGPHVKKQRSKKAN